MLHSCIEANHTFPTDEAEHDAGDSSDDSVDSKDNEDPMAAYIKSERKASSSKHPSAKTKEKKRKHDGETKEERLARKAAKRAKKEGKGRGSGKVKEERDEYSDLAKQFGGGKARPTERNADERPRDGKREVDDRNRRLLRYPDQDDRERERSYTPRDKVERDVRRGTHRDRDHGRDYDGRRDGDRPRNDRDQRERYR